jgi:predicted DNA-binding transcriptional regulator YafY
MLGHAWGIWTSDHPVDVLLRFTPRIASRVIATTWHESQEVRELSNGGIELQLLIAEPTEIRNWILGWGQECEVVAPASLRESIRSELQSALAAYSRLATNKETRDRRTVHVVAEPASAEAQAR